MTWETEDDRVENRIHMKEHPPHGGHRRGMTLIEVLAATVLLGVGVVGLISVATLAMRNQQRTEQRASALCLAQEKLADVELVGPHVWMLGYPTQGSQEQGRVVHAGSRGESDLWPDLGHINYSQLRNAIREEGPPSPVPPPAEW